MLTQLLGKIGVRFIKGSVKLAKEMRKTVEDLKIKHASSSISDYITISLGVASVFPDVRSSSNKFIDLADKVLYKAKQGGRNRVECDHY